MSTHELTSKARDLRELKRMADELAQEITSLEDEIKAHMGDREEIIAGEYKITWRPVTSHRVDTAALRRTLPDVAAQFSRTITTRRFMVS